MNPYLCDKIKKIKPYAFEEGDCNIRLDANESFISLPDELRGRAAAAAAGLDYNRYPDPLARGVCAAYGRYIGVSPDFITAGNGSDELIGICLGSFLEKGGKVLLAAPDFSMYNFYSHIAELETVVLQKSESLRISAEEIAEAARREKPDMIIFSNPCSPTGAGMTAGEVISLFDAYPDAIYIVDEAYMDFWSESVIPEALSRQNVIVLRTCSKAAGLAALRLGFAVTNRDMTSALRSAKSPVNVNSLTQAVAEAVLSDTGYLRSCVETIKASRDELYKGLKALEKAFTGKIAVFPTVANFVFIKCIGIGAPALHAGLISHSIITRLMGDYIRITAGSPEENTALLRAVSEIMEEVGK